MYLCHRPLDADVACRYPPVVIALAFVLVLRETLVAVDILMTVR